MSLTNYQRAVKEAKSKYFSDILARNYFSTINSVINPSIDLHFDDPVTA